MKNARTNDTKYGRGDTMGDAIAMTSPSGRMSKRARTAAAARLANDLFGPNSGFAGWNPEPSDEQKRANRITQLQSYIRTLETCCANRLQTGRQNGTTRALAEAQRELATLNA